MKYGYVEPNAIRSACKAAAQKFRKDNSKLICKLADDDYVRTSVHAETYFDIYNVTYSCSYDVVDVMVKFYGPENSLVSTGKVFFAKCTQFESAEEFDSYVQAAVTAQLNDSVEVWKAQRAARISAKSRMRDQLML